MSQPSIDQLFGSGSEYDSTEEQLNIRYDAFRDVVSEDLGSLTPLEIFAALIKYADLYLRDMVDETVMATSRLDISSPAQRNGVDKTLFSYTFEFYGDYNAPEFDPTDL